MYDDEQFEISSMLFRDLTSAAVNVSGKSGGIETTTLEIEATKVYTRLVLSSLTIQKVLPNSSCDWDFPSLAILVRSYMETTHKYFYLSERGLTEEESVFRRKLHFYHLNMEKFKLYSEYPKHEVLTGFEEKLPLAKAELVNLPFFGGLSKYFQNKIKSGSTDMHFSDETMAKNTGLISEHFSFYYRLLSNHTHGSPFSTTSQSNTRGRGFKNKSEVFYITLILNILNKYLSALIKHQVLILSLKNECENSFDLAVKIYGESEI